jgi:hypothetical protein
MKLLLIEEKRCGKISDRSTGQLTYRLLKDEEGVEAFVAIVGNESVGYFSREPVSVLRIHQCLQAAVKVGKAIPSQRLRQVFKGQSVNNGGFLAAILRAEGILAPSPDNAFQHVLAGDAAEWRQALLKKPGYALPHEPAPEATQDTATAEKPAKSKKKRQKATAEEAAQVPEAQQTDEVPSSTVEQGAATVTEDAQDSAVE